MPALLLILSFYPFSISPLIFVSFVPAFYYISKNGISDSFRYMWLVGIVFWAFVIFWIHHVNVLGNIVLPLYYGLYFGMFGMGASYFFKKNIIFPIPFLWGTLEYLRSILPPFAFGWYSLASSLHDNLLFIQIADIAGIYGISAVVMTVNILSFVALKSLLEKRYKASVIALADILIIFLLIYSYGAYSISKYENSGTKKKKYLKIGLVQPNILQKDKWNFAKKPYVLDKYKKLALFTLYDKPELVIFPESVYPGNFLKEREKGDFCDTVLSDGAGIIFGAVRVSEDKVFNSVFYFDKSENFYFYDKINLVPFGEYIPFKPFFSLLKLDSVAYSLGVGDFSKGREITLFDVESGAGNTVKVLPLVCFEDTLPYFVSEGADKGAELAVVVTNDAWFGESGAPYHHLYNSVFRAVENRLPIVRSANTGISAFISENGRVEDIICDKNGNPLFISGGIVKEVAAGKGKGTFFSRYGRYFPLLEIFVVILFFIGSIKDVFGNRRRVQYD